MTNAEMLSKDLRTINLDFIKNQLTYSHEHMLGLLDKASDMHVEALSMAWAAILLADAKRKKIQ